ncbi:redox-regulated ATPase YchF [Candidatus Roizmanbacteria bacterium RIFCSPLOWO2_02_FULL_37_19]|uniref:Ribosome-binding ATPase YchF n=1 Tax=Candidatus Roizmanbacteria bacterium RIFCSPHIGHO2_02_FULL_37_24 TaxID=1802037 RepID=A0A1F7GVN7_9BACT|nr:MAG: redox-regulated ATPase YchF [Candidatus Roizmanbacteria bacterium RIFCSPHIGHO2_01_FULL_38_41]OGK22646.1 MAG: redox-regulated ATPase YchF [Candidatus Roizmanbacteria bacterium RIFCSPHIGHO2_02_FULL_37_24]OGK32496.1 MAG: redox-regulated ATPase YchF [Candidatus Roizmanbacteria bacterium RIFCSPHIGHO2_12_FULL_37_23]OGK45111.1 MAG: redox-regulated ATPase YchF [Candidatus Roizmanbacteria bacterium RIFCSPLOWO2_01_FULL_37_57]OGK54476.1 MAG: redox-regulated ATPase YchF [Candidatus Roizmanbacteria 
MLTAGIVGLPNVGKSTLFNALLKKQVADAANYPFCTIDPNIGVVEVPDERLPKLAKIVETEKIVPSAVEFCDIAGLVRGASKGEGLGNQFLSHIREVDAIIHVVRLFEDENVTHVSQKLDPKDDIETIETELILKDLETLSRQEKPNKKLSKEDDIYYDAVEILKEKLNKNIAAKEVQLSDIQKESVKKLNLLTIKPVLYVLNLSEKQLINLPEIKKLISTHFNEFQPILTLCAKLESDIVVLSPDEQKEYLQQYNLEEPGLNRLINAAYDLLGLISFLTAGKKEVRAWPIKKGTTAQNAAGVIHTDFIQHFIKAEIVPYQQFVEVGGWIHAREKGLAKMCGRDYEMQDGDVVDFKVGV